MGKKKGRKEVLPPLEPEVDDLAAQLLAEMQAEIAPGPEQPGESHDESRGGSHGGSEGPKGSKEPAEAAAPGPRRNRRREKLAARDAATQKMLEETAAEIAESPNERQIELDAVAQRLGSRGLHHVDILPDGNCMFASVSDQLALQSIEWTHKELRAATARQMLDNRDDYSPFLEQDLDEYCKELAATSMWGGELELLALSRILKSPIEVVQASGSHIVGQEQPNQPLVLAYYKKMYGLGAHYNSARPN